MLAEGTIKTMDEFHNLKGTDEPEEPEGDGELENCGPPANPILVPIPLPEEGRQFATFEEAVADLKNMDKEARITPNAFLVGITFAAEQYLEAMRTYCQEQYRLVFPDLDEKQMEYLRGQIRRVHNASEEMYQKVERERERTDETQRKE